MKPLSSRNQQLRLIRFLLFLAIAAIVVFILPGFEKKGYWLNNVLPLAAILLLLAAIFFINKAIRHFSTSLPNNNNTADELPLEGKANVPAPDLVEKRFQALIQNSQGITALVDKNFNFLFRSSSAARITGWTNEDITSIPKQYVHPEDWEPLKKMITNSIAHYGEVLPVVTRLKHKEGHYIWLEGTVKNMLNDPHVGGLVINLHDATRQKESEEKIIKANRLYLFISQVNQVIVKLSDEASLFNEVCRIAVDIGQFKMAWIGLTDEASQYLVPAVYAGNGKDYLANLSIPATANGSQSHGPTGTAIRQGMHVVCNDIQTAPEMAPWRISALDHGYLSSIALPIKKSGKVIGAFSLYAAVKNFFSKEEIDLLLEVTQDISFGLEIFEREKLRTEAEAMVLKSKQQYTMLTEISPVGIFHTDESGNTTFVNPRWCQIAGLPAEQALGNGWLQAVHEHDRTNVLANWQEATKNHQPSSMEYRFVHNDTSVRWVLGQATPEKDATGETIGYVGTATDITALKNAENAIAKEKELSDSIINSLPSIFFLYNKAGKFLRWSKNMENVTKYTPQEIARMHPLDFYDDSDKPMIAEKIANTLQTGADAVQADLLLKTGEKIPYYFTAKTVEYEGDVCLAGVAIDFTERTKVQEEIKLTTEKLRRLTDHLQNIREEERKKIGREIHDELGQQLTAINMDVAWIDKKIPEENVLVKMKLKNIIQLLNGSNQAVRRILTELRPLMLDDYGLTDAIAKLAKQFTDTTGIPVHLLDEAGEINVTEQVANCIFRACQESFTNITRYAQANNVMMRLSTTHNTVHVSITDDGIGFDIASIQYGKSFGILGMKERIISQGGIFDITSTAGKGTKIAFSLPLKNKSVG
ncbi:MAG: domain S-box protein [Ferruginibacter sp.]|uniref:PAS domain S-box protein n=1 Tax=Ferruginibacter sp. TaxID=1940288 RepID=UPI00265A9467|nr:PAS domain S-box protein [Ferruginibacter sp.]MDB5279892.1 domain S-box protein [Ferruginibacter sp.]